MQFGWISGINAAVILILVIINIIAAKKELCVDLKSKRFTVNLLEQAGRYGCMFFMILPFLTQNREFALASPSNVRMAWTGRPAFVGLHHSLDEKTRRWHRYSLRFDRHSCRSVPHKRYSALSPHPDHSRAAVRRGSFDDSAGKPQTRFRRTVKDENSL